MQGYSYKGPYPQVYSRLFFIQPNRHKRTPPFFVPLLSQKKKEHQAINEAGCNCLQGGGAEYQDSRCAHCAGRSAQEHASSEAESGRAKENDNTEMEALKTEQLEQQQQPLSSPESTSLQPDACSDSTSF